MLAEHDDRVTDPAPLDRSTFADVGASEYAAGPPEGPEPRTSDGTMDGDLPARLRRHEARDHDALVLFLAATLTRPTLEAAAMLAEEERT